MCIGESLDNISIGLSSFVTKISKAEVIGSKEMNINIQLCEEYYDSNPNNNKCAKSLGKIPNTTTNGD